MGELVKIRCPYCLHGFGIRPTSLGDRRLRCPRCTRQFSLAKALPSTGTASVAATVTRQPPTVGLGAGAWLLALVIGFLMVEYSRTWTPSVRGPEFLTYYVITLIGLLIASGVLRSRVQDIDEFRWMGFLIYEAIGVFRFIDGYALGMRRYLLLIALMVIGGAFFFTRADHRRNRNNSDGSGCGAGTSGCGGGGGGGGCGGCGG